MRKTVFITMLCLIVGSCSDVSLLSTEEDVLVDRISSREVLSIADETHDLGDESLWIVCSIGARLLESKLDSYRAAGLTEADFRRLPDNELTANLKRLYFDMKPLTDLK